MSVESTETFEKRFRDLQKKYIYLRMNSRVAEQEAKQWKREAADLERREMQSRERAEGALERKKSLESELKEVERERIELRNMLRLCRRDNERLRDGIESKDAEVARGQERINELAQMVAGMVVGNGRETPERERPVRSGVVRGRQGEATYEEWEYAEEEYEERGHTDGGEMW